MRARLKELAAVRVSYGYRRLHIMLRREGWPANRKLIERLYSEEGLTLKRKKPKRRRSAVRRERSTPAASVNERWAMDFVHDTLSNSRTVRVLTVLDVYSWECVALEVGVGFRGEDVGRVLSAAAEERGSLPKMNSVDNGTEFTSRALDHWAYWNRVKLDFSRPGKPTDNPFIEAFNGSLRRECLSQHWFVDLDDAQRTLHRWKDEYNNVRPHSSLDDQAPRPLRRRRPLHPSLKSARFLTLLVDPIRGAVHVRTAQKPYYFCAITLGARNPDPLERLVRVPNVARREGRLGSEPSEAGDSPTRLAHRAPPYQRATSNWRVNLMMSERP